MKSMKDMKERMKSYWENKKALHVVLHDLHVLHVSLLFVLCTAVLVAQRGPSILVVRDVTLIDGTGAAARPHVSIVARDGVIASIANAGDPVPTGATVIDGAGKFAIPGLFDAHVHVTGGTHAQAVEDLARALVGGVTSVWDMAGDARMAAELAREAAAGEIKSPSIYYVSLMAGPPFFTDPRVVGASRGFQPGTAPWAQSITTSTDFGRAVAAAKGTGATAIKLYAALDADTVRLATAEALAQGLRVVAHATVFPGKPSDLVAARVTMVAHAAYLVWEGMPASTDFTKRASGDFAGVPADSPAIERLLESMRDNNVALNPTLWVLGERQPDDAVNRARTPWMYAVTRRANALGVPIVAGTDGLNDRGNTPLPMIHHELELLVRQAGLTPMQALRSATQIAARTIGVENTAGTLEAGKAADLLLLTTNPLDDISNTKTIQTVIKNGRAVK
jgi:imidazolonepropionase-like amidohydrolase